MLITNSYILFLHSNYKHYNCYQLLIAVTPAGGMAYMSEPFEGAMSDKKIVEKSDFLSFVDEGDIFLGNFNTHFS